MSGIQLQPGYGYPVANPAQQQYASYNNPYQMAAYNAQTPQAQQQQQFQQHQQYTTTYTIV